jgi:acyl dehydratase
MGIDEQSLGYETPSIQFDYDWRDTVLYALGVGATAEEELEYLYEGRGPKVLPTFSTIPTFTAFDRLVDRIGCDRTGLLHHGQEISLRKVLRPKASLRVHGRVDALYDLKRMAMAVLVIDAHDEQGDLVVRGKVTLLLLKDGGFGGERPPRRRRIELPDRAPDFETRELIDSTQALLYRLNGDYNPLHADPAFAQRAGFDRPILHGLCTLGYAGRTVVKHACHGDPARLKELRAEFQNPVFPGDTLIVRGWREADEVIVLASTEERPNAPCLTQTVAMIS